MAATITFDLPKAKTVQGLSPGLAMITGSIAFDDSYPTGGEDVSAIANKFKSMYVLLCDGFGGYIYEYTYSTKKLVVRAPITVTADSGTAATNNFIFKGASALLEVDGTGTAFQQAALQVTDSTDLSSLTAVRFIAIGVV